MHLANKVQKSYNLNLYVIKYQGLHTNDLVLTPAYVYNDNLTRGDTPQWTVLSDTIQFWFSSILQYLLLLVLPIIMGCV